MGEAHWRGGLCICGAGAGIALADVKLTAAARTVARMVSFIGED